jgi:3'-5' exoribonuclease
LEGWFIKVKGKDGKDNRTDYLLDDLHAGDAIAGVLAATNIRVARTRNDSPYLDLRLTDGKNVVAAKLWDYRDNMPQGKVFFITARVEHYNGQLQLALNSLRAAQPQEFTPEDFLPPCPVPLEELWGRWDKLASRVDDPGLRFLLELVKKNYKQKLEHAPGAIYHHHAYLGGCLHHSVSVAEIAGGLADHRMSKDLLIVGGLVHDLGKLFSYKWSEGVFAYSDEGQFLDHTLLGVMSIRDLLKKAGVERIVGLKLLHIIAAHHGMLELGAPVVPKIPEALVIHHCDMIDSQTDKMIGARSNATGDWTRVYGLGYVYTGEPIIAQLSENIDKTPYR